jgi:hypothetical protein
MLFSVAAAAHPKRENSWFQMFNMGSKDQKEKTEEELEKEKRRMKRMKWILFVSSLGITGYLIYFLFDVVSEGSNLLETLGNTVETKYSRDSVNVIKNGSLALHKSLRIFLKVIDQDAGLRQNIEQVLGEFDSSDKIRLLNTNFVQLISHRLYFFVRKDGKWRKNYYESRIQYFFPIINIETGAVAVLKATLLTEDGANVESNLLHLESVHLCDAAPFAAQFGDSYFTQLYEFFVEKELLYGWNKEEQEIEIYRNKDLQKRFKVLLPSILPPAIRPNLEPTTGFFFPDTIDTRLLPPPTPLP